MADTSSNAGILKRAWRVLVSPSARWSILSLLAAGIAIGAGGVIFTQVAAESTSSTEFCSSACHSMKAFTAPEYHASVHAANSRRRTGRVRRLPRAAQLSLQARLQGEGRHRRHDRRSARRHRHEGEVRERALAHGEQGLGRNALERFRELPPLPRLERHGGIGAAAGGAEVRRTRRARAPAR